MQNVEIILFYTSFPFQSRFNPRFESNVDQIGSLLYIQVIIPYLDFYTEFYIWRTVSTHGSYTIALCFTLYHDDNAAR